MKAILLTVSAIGLLAAAPAYAESGEILLSANVAAACGAGNHLSTAESAPGWDQSDIVVDLADGNGQFAGTSVANRSFGNVWCNGPANVTLEVGALTSTSTTTDTGSFTNRFDVRVTTDAGVYVGEGENFVISTVGGSGVTTKSGSTAGAFETGLQSYGGADLIEVLADPLNKRPVAGAYSGYLRFTASVG